MKAPRPDGVQDSGSRISEVYTVIQKYIQLYTTIFYWLHRKYNANIDYKTRDSTEIERHRTEEQVSNYRPFLCLSLLWKLLTCVIADKVNNFLEKVNLLPEEQKGCMKKSRKNCYVLYVNRWISRGMSKEEEFSCWMGWLQEGLQECLSQLALKSD